MYLVLRTEQAIVFIGAYSQPQDYKLYPTFLRPTIRIHLSVLSNNFLQYLSMAQFKGMANHGQGERHLAGKKKGNGACEGPEWVCGQREWKVAGKKTGRQR